MVYHQAPAAVQAPAAPTTPEQKLKQLDKSAAGGYIPPVEHKARRQAILDTMSGAAFIGFRRWFFSAVCWHRPLKFKRVLRNEQRVVIRKRFGAFEAAAKDPKPKL